MNVQMDHTNVQLIQRVSILRVPMRVFAIVDSLETDLGVDRKKEQKD